MKTTLTLKEVDKQVRAAINCGNRCKITQLHKIRNEILELFNVVFDEDFRALDDNLPQVLENNLNVKIDWDWEIKGGSNNE